MAGISNSQGNLTWNLYQVDKMLKFMCLSEANKGTIKYLDLHCSQEVDKLNKKKN